MENAVYAQARISWEVTATFGKGSSESVIDHIATTHSFK